MKPLQPPPIPGKTEAKRFDNALRTVFSVPKAEIDRREAEWQREQNHKPNVREVHGQKRKRL
jgi:hypothetical protein